MYLPPELVHHASEHLGVPEVDRAEYAEQAATEKNVVNVRDDEISVMDEKIDRGGGHVDSAQASDDEHRHERQGETHRGREPERAAPNGA